MMSLIARIKLAAESADADKTKRKHPTEDHKQTLHHLPFNIHLEFQTEVNFGLVTLTLHEHRCTRPIRDQLHGTSSFFDTHVKIFARGRAVAADDKQPDKRFVFLSLQRLINIHMLVQLSPLIKLPID